jgi:hypothetical protein
MNRGAPFGGGGPLFDAWTDEVEDVFERRVLLLILLLLLLLLMLVLL